jgi:hypothetical protein
MSKKSMRRPTGAETPEEVPSPGNQLFEALDEAISAVPPELVHMQGFPIIRPPSGVRKISVPDQFANHPLVVDKCFYTLPPELLKFIGEQVPALTAAKDLWKLETTLADTCEDHTCRVGFRNGQPITYYLLRIAKPLDITMEDAQALSWVGFNDAKLAQIKRNFDKRSTWYNTVARGYAGWLNCNRDFLRERDLALPETLSVVSLRPDSFADASGNGLPANIIDFLIRWRLLGMAGPRLPVPMRPMLSGQFPMSIVPQLMAAGGLFNLPDTFPVPSRDELREMLEDAVRAEKPEHLDEWMKIAAKNNPAKNRITYYARLFELHHYWELLQQRHENSLDRQVAKLRCVLAEYLGISTDSVKSYLRFLRDRKDLS